jgi:hypothetical protein
MDLKQAEALLDKVIWDLGKDSAKLKLLGNQSTYVVIIQRGMFFLWEEADLLKYFSTRDGQELLARNRASLAS